MDSGARYIPRSFRLHITTLAGCLVPPRRASAGLSFLLTTLIAWVYALMVGGNTPVLRRRRVTLEDWRYIYRTPQILNLLAAVAIAFLIADPDQLFDPASISFQSCCAH